MKTIPVKFFLCPLAFVLLFLAGCSDPITSVESELDDDGIFDAVEVVGKTEFDAGPFTVVFEGRQISKGETKYGYTLINHTNKEAVGNLLVELPQCAPAPLSWKPTKDASIYVDAVSGLPVLDFKKKLGKNQSFNFRMWFPGDIPIGVVKVILVHGSDRYEALLPGACGVEAVSDLALSGTVFTDADAGGTIGLGDIGIADVTVELLGAGNTVVSSTVTDAVGAYSFSGLSSGAWTVRVPASTAADDFNEVLLGTFDPTSATQLTINLTDDSVGNDFGFRPKIDDLVADLEAGVLTSNARDLAYWKLEMSTNKKGKLSDKTLKRYLNDVEKLFLPVPFKFRKGKEIKDADAILSDKSKDLFKSFTRALLVAELNYVAGSTIDQADGLLETILAWAEGVYVDNDPSNPNASKSAKVEDVIHAERLLRTFSTTGGGGSNE